MLQETTLTQKESRWESAVQWWQSVYPGVEPLKTFPSTLEGHSNVVTFLEKAGWSKDTIDNFKRQSRFLNQ